MSGPKPTNISPPVPLTAGQSSAGTVTGDDVDWDTGPSSLPAHALDDHSDTNLGTPADGDMVVWDSGTSTYVTTAPPTGSGPLSNYTATTDPTATDDDGDGYEVGSRWVNTTSGEEFVCVDASTGAAVWTSTTATGSFSGDATDVPIVDSGGHFTGADVETALEELATRPLKIAMGFDGGGSAITTSQKFYLPDLPGCTILRATAYCDTGTITIELKKASYANHPGSYSSITGGSGIAISSGNKVQDSTLSGWTTTITAGDGLEASVSAVSGAKIATLMLTATRT